MSVLKKHTTVGEMLSATTRSVAMNVFVKTATLLWTAETARVSNILYIKRACFHTLTLDHALHKL